MKFSRGSDGDNHFSISVDCWLYGWVRGTRMWIYVEVMVMVMILVAKYFGCVRRVDMMVAERNIYDGDGSG